MPARSILVCCAFSSTDQIAHRIVPQEAFGSRECFVSNEVALKRTRLAQGNLAEFVKQRPEAKAYYELASADLKFILPEPGFLEGIKSKDKPILKMTHVAFKCASCALQPEAPPSAGLLPCRKSRV